MGASLLVFKNKSDVLGCMGEEEIRQVRTSYFAANAKKSSVRILNNTQALKLDSIKTHRWRIIPCSAVTGQGLKEGLDWVVRDAKERLFLF
jgi:ADP-ribosylation factor-like protein 2